jgi:hypothetical protein
MCRPVEDAGEARDQRQEGCHPNRSPLPSLGAARFAASSEISRPFSTMIIRTLSNGKWGSANVWAKVWCGPTHLQRSHPPRHGAQQLSRIRGPSAVVDALPNDSQRWGIG